MQGTTGRFRIYLEFDLACGRSHRVRVDTSDKPINIAERVQPIAPDQPGWRYTWRADAESSHSELDRSLPWKRMPYYRPDNQDLFMYAHALLHNERAHGEWITRRRSGRTRRKLTSPNSGAEVCPERDSAA